jgi:hypothetical protein
LYDRIRQRLKIWNIIFIYNTDFSKLL